MNDRLFVLISTIDERIAGIETILQPYDDHVTYIVSHQTTAALSETSSRIVAELKMRGDVRYDALEGRGVARNRNNALEMVEEGTVCLILDDDVQLCPDAFGAVLHAFSVNPEADFISFKILDMQGEDYKRYPVQKQWHTLFTLTGIGTTEMAFRGSAVLRSHIRFDERFGPGAPVYPIGEDFIFAMDLRRKGMRMLFCPIPIVRHPKGSTGGSLDENVIIGRGAVFARVFGRLAFAADLYFALRKRTSYRGRYSFWRYFSLMLKGSDDFLGRAGNGFA